MQRHYRLRRVDWVELPPARSRTSRLFTSLVLAIALGLVGLMILSALGSIELPEDFWAEVSRSVRVIVTGRS